MRTILSSDPRHIVVQDTGLANALAQLNTPTLLPSRDYGLLARLPTSVGTPDVDRVAAPAVTTRLSEGHESRALFRSGGARHFELARITPSQKNATCLHG